MGKRMIMLLTASIALALTLLFQPDRVEELNPRRDVIKRLRKLGVK